MIPEAVRIFEVGPRDGLQNEDIAVPVQVRMEFIERLAAAGITKIEEGSFVSPRWMPQMAHSDEVILGLQMKRGVTYSALVPNMRGFDAALAAGVKEVAVFAAAAETFSRKNTNCSIDECLERFLPVTEAAKSHGIAVRGYVSCGLGCPYEGQVPVARVVQIAEALHAMGCYEVSLGDTIGVGTPNATKALVEATAASLPTRAIAVHFHDTYGQALANICAALETGISTVDASAGGLGGCPYAPGAAGNVATEDVIYMLDGMGIETGVDLRALVEASYFIADHLGRTRFSRVAEALRANIAYPEAGRVPSSYFSLDHGLGETLDSVRETVREFSVNEIAPRADEIGRANEFPRDLWPRLGDLGLFGMTVAEEYGGAGLGYLAHVVPWKRYHGPRPASVSVMAPTPTCA
jgi:hydroxymethylglutaryl-CoA lyase